MNDCGFLFFIILTTCIFVPIGRPKELLLFAGAINGLILPIALAIILFAATKSKIMKGYKHPLWMELAGWMVVAIMSWMGWITFQQYFKL
jgi:Mn2+/Fe2+ NRAMP family transporter